MHTVTTSEWTEAIDADVQVAVAEVVKDYIPTLDRYLEELDKGTFECECTGNVTIKFTPDHQVIATLPLELLEGYTWGFRKPSIDLEVDGTFEAHLS